ncbi:MAG TPA: DnaA regulatory inactivator Hda [Pseudomonadales bacterium]
MNEDRSRQLTLPFPLERRCTLANFEAGGNAELIAALGQCGSAGRFSALWLVGDAGCGKSHLLQGACHAAVGAGLAAAYLPKQVMAGGPNAIEGLDRFDVVAVDDLEHWVSQRPWEDALLGLYQGLFKYGGNLLLASTQSPLDLSVGLPDLASRLRAAQVFGVRALDDADRARAIERLAAQRGLELGPDVVNFILRRAPRRMDRLIATFDALDRGALAQQRRLTIPLAKEVLGL